jgi:hypothetical protein
MYDSISETGSEHLTIFWLGNDKGGAGGRVVCSAIDFVTESYQVLFETRQILNSTGAGHLVTEAQSERFKQILIPYH